MVTYCWEDGGGDIMNELKALRLNKNCTAKEVSQALDITESYLFMLESGSRTPSLKLARKIADFYGVTTDDVFDIFFDNTPNDALGDNVETA